LIFDFNIV